MTDKRKDKEVKDIINKVKDIDNQLYTVELTFKEIDAIIDGLVYYMDTIDPIEALFTDETYERIRKALDYAREQKGVKV